MSESTLRTDYSLAATDGLGLESSRWVLCYGGPGMLEYDYAKQAWVQDNELFSVLIGQPETRHITEDEAPRVIEHNGGKWTDPPRRD